jgi:two-component system, NtrC family, nitrogen regulation sensor histidine kinase NtrY
VRPRWRFTLRWRLWLLATLVAALATSLALLTEALTGQAWLARAAGIGGGALVGALLLDRLAAPALSLFRALAGTVTSYRDGDFAFDVVWPHDDELRDLVQAHNALGQVLRDQHLALVQRELLLDTMVQNTPVAMVLSDDSGRIVLGNLAARQWLHRGRRLEGGRLADLLAALPPALADALRSGRDGLVTVSAQAPAAPESPQARPGAPGHDAGAGDVGNAGDATDEAAVLHVAGKDFVLNGRAHQLLMLRPLTRELRRQEVQIWKKVIRVISHELNNSLAPIASLAFSGTEMLRRGQHDRLPEALAAIGERARHLESFVRGYADVAKLPAPRPEAIDWPAFAQRLQVQMPFVIEGEPPARPLQADPVQLAQALLNLVKNAHESGSDPAAITLRARAGPTQWRIELKDRGSGMSEAVMAQAWLPFYSTKRDGSGLGLALVREIVEAHGGHLSLGAREGGGTTVTLLLPG